LASAPRPVTGQVLTGPQAGVPLWPAGL